MNACEETKVSGRLPRLIPAIYGGVPLALNHASPVKRFIFSSTLKRRCRLEVFCNQARLLLHVQVKGHASPVGHRSAEAA